MNYQDVRQPSGATKAAPLLRQVNGLPPQAWEIVSLASAWIACIAFYNFQAFGLLKLVAPAAMLIIPSLANWRMVRSSPEALWTPLFAFRLSVAIFLGFGGLLTENVPIEVLMSQLTAYPYSDAEAGKVFLIWLTGTTLTLFACWVASLIAPLPADTVVRERRSSGKTFQIGIAFFLAGWCFQVFVLLLPELGYYDLGVIPGALVIPFQAALAVGVFLLSLWGLERRGAGYLVVAAALLGATLLGFIAMGKESVILPILFFGVAVLIDRYSMARAAMLALFLIFTFSVLQPAVAHARALADSSPEAVATFQERLGYYADYFELQSAGASEASQAENFLRFGHTFVAAFVVSRYDGGLPSDDIEGSLAAVVPRAIWPDKPVVTQQAEELYFLLSGNQGSALASTTFADIYWNAGWLGATVLPLIWGGLMWLATMLNYQIVRARDWIMMPFVLMTFRIALAMENAFIPAIFVPTVMAAVGYFVLRTVRPLIDPLPQAASRPS